MKDATGELYKSKTGFMGAVMLVVLFSLCILTPYIDRYSPVKQNYTALLQSPSAEHYFGTDRYGRDIWSESTRKSPGPGSAWRFTSRFKPEISPSSRQVF